MVYAGLLTGQGALGWHLELPGAVGNRVSLGVWSGCSSFPVTQRIALVYSHCFASASVLVGS